MRIANKLRDKSADCSFICKELSGSLIKLIKDQGFKVFLLSQEIRMPNKNSSIIVDKLFNWKTDALQTAEILKNLQTNTLIVDHYGIDKKWEDYQKPYCKKIMAIDDLDNRKHSEISKTDAKDELKISNNRFLDEIGQRPKLFAYPYGEYNLDIIL